MSRRSERVNVEWATANADGRFTWEQAQVEVLMDIRAELRDLNNLLRCPNFQRIPSKLDAIRRNTSKPKRKVKP